MNQLKQKLRNPLIQQYVLEILLPLVGYFFFDWSLLVIILFYMMDFLGSEMAKTRRVSKIYQHHQQKSLKEVLMSAAISLLAYSLLMILGSFMVLNIWPERFPNAVEESNVFILDEGWFLLPLVIFVYHVKDVLAFYVNRRYVIQDPKKYQQYAILDTLLITLMALIGIISVLTFVQNDILAIIVFIAAKLIYDFTIVRYFTKASLKSA